MLFTNTGAENITVINSLGVRSAQCSMEFDITQKFVPEPSLNFSVVIILLFISIILRGYASFSDIYYNERSNSDRMECCYFSKLCLIDAERYSEQKIGLH